MINLDDKAACRRLRVAKPFLWCAHRSPGQAEMEQLLGRVRCTEGLQQIVGTTGDSEARGRVRERDVVKVVFNALLRKGRQQRAPRPLVTRKSEVDVTAISATVLRPRRRLHHCVATTLPSHDLTTVVPERVRELHRHGEAIMRGDLDRLSASALLAL